MDSGQRLGQGLASAPLEALLVWHRAPPSAAPHGSKAGWGGQTRLT